MVENTIQTVLKIIETVVAPSISELKAHAIVTDKKFEMVDHKLDALTDRMDSGFKTVNERMDHQSKTLSERLDQQSRTLSERMDFQFKALMGELQTVRAQIETSNLRQYSELRERVAVLESQIRPKQ